MDDNSTILFNIFFNRIVNTFQEIFSANQQNYTIIDKFNTNCKDDIDCQDIALFCNTTSSLCQCATFFFRNEIAGICEFQKANFTHWIKNNGTDELFGTNTNSTTYQLPLSAICVMIISAICIFLCGIYVCLGDENKDTGSGVLSKEQKESIQIEIHQ